MADNGKSLYLVHSVNSMEAFDVYTLEEMQYSTRQGQIFVWTWSEYDRPPQLQYASVIRLDRWKVKLHSITEVIHETPHVTNFWDILQSFENQSLWKYFICDGDGSWIHRDLITGLLKILHDGSFMVDLDPDVWSAGFIIHCNQTNQTAIGSVVEKIFLC